LCSSFLFGSYSRDKPGREFMGTVDGVTTAKSLFSRDAAGELVFSPLIPASASRMPASQFPAVGVGFCGR